MTQPSLIESVLRLISLSAAALLAAVPAAFAQGQASPVQGYLSVEAFELRKEFVMRFDTIAARIGAGTVTVIDPANRPGLEKSIGDWLIGKCPVEVDGKPLAMELDRVHFVRPDPEKGLVVEDRDSVPVSEALVGVVFAAPLDGPPETVRVVWEVFPADGSEAIVEAGVREQRAVRKLSPENPELIWKNEAGLAVPELLSVPEIPESGWLDRVPMIWINLAILLCGLIAYAANLIARKGSRRGPIVGVSLLPLMMVLILCVVKQTGPQPAEVSPEQADEISYALLRNIYHAFDYRRESDIYDTLAKSATGDLLTQIYLEIQRSLQVETQGGARVRITDVDLRKCELAAPSADRRGGFLAECDWVAVGTVTHWGHTHDRVNRYRAKLTIAPVEGRWRLVGLELVNEERI